MSGTATDSTAYTGAVCMSITFVGNTTDLPLSDPFCNTDKCLAFKAAHTASQDAVSYNYQFEYGHFTAWYYLAIVGFAAAANAFRQYRNWRPSQAPRGPRTKASLAHKAVALIRAVKYRSIGGVGTARLGTMGLGMLIFLLFSWLLFLLMTFWAHPYYRERRGYGSPPLGVRTGLMSTALTPIIVALSGKVNVITWLTGISHEKLNVMHRWASYLCLFLAVVHTVPFLYIAVDRCGSDGLRAQFYKPNAYEYTGVPPLGMLVGLCVLSVPWIRYRFYNLFYRIHIPMYIAYLGLMFWHAGDQLDSWAYLWATLAVWIFSVLVRLFHRWQTFHVKRNWFSGFPAVLQELPGGMTRVSLLVPCELRWKPGQHFFIRIPHVSALQNHPFTVANIPSDGKGTCDMHDMIFYVRALGGLTRNLLHSVAEQGDRPVQMHLDGPYGGLVENLPDLYQSLVLVAGGSGVSACLPHMLHAARSIQADKGMVTQIRLVWMVRHPSHAQWVLDELQEVRTTIASEALQLDLYVTDTSLPKTSESTNTTLKTPTGARTSAARNVVQDLEKAPVTETSNLSTALLNMGALHDFKPYLPDLLSSLLTRRRVGVFGCGPLSLAIDLGNAVAKAQNKVLKGELDVVTLYTEMFSW